MDEPGDDLFPERPEETQAVTEGATEPAAGSALDRVAASWQRRGYQVRYRDEYLVQLVRRTWRDVPALTFILMGALVLLAGVIALLIRRRWDVVSLSVTPEGRVITHRQRAPRPPVP